MKYATLHPFIILIVGAAIIVGCGRDASPSSESNVSTDERPQPATEGFILRTGEGEILQNGVVVKASPLTGTERSILAEQTFPGGRSTSLHIHEQGDELFYIASGSGLATLGDVTAEVGPGDVIFVPRNAVHRIGSRGDDSLRVIFFMDSPELVEEFRAIHERVISEPDRPITAEERAAISARIGGSRAAEPR